MTFNGFVGKQQTISDLRSELNSYLIKLMEVLDWFLSQIKMADRGVGLQHLRGSSVMRGKKYAISGVQLCRVGEKKSPHVKSNDTKSLSQPSRCDMHFECRD